MCTQSHHFILCNADLRWGIPSSQGMFSLPSHFERSYYEGSSFLWNWDMLEWKHILMSVLLEDKIDVFTENARKNI